MFDIINCICINVDRVSNHPKKFKLLLLSYGVCSRFNTTQFRRGSLVPRVTECSYYIVTMISIQAGSCSGFQ